MKRAPLLALVVLMFLAIGSFAPPAFYSDSAILESNNEIVEGSPIESPLNTGYSLSQDELQGTLDPFTVEQRGFVSTGNVSARTDIPLNTVNSLPIDTIHDWVSSEANVEISNLKRLYAYNGTFTEGIPGVNEDPAWDAQYYPFGWNSTSYTITGSTTQRSFYESASDSFAGLENEGAVLGTGVNTRFAHGQDSYVNWIQNVSNIPYTEDFKFSLDFLYLHGPLDVALGTAISLELLVNGTIYWNQSLASLGSRNTWYNTGDVEISIPGAPETLEVEIRLRIYTNLVLWVSDYGSIDATYLTVHLDNLFLIGQTPPTPEEVSLSFTAGSLNAPVVGLSGNGACTITNPTFWNTSNLVLSFDSNASIGFDYNVNLLSHRFSNSSVTTNTLEEGINFNVEEDLNPEIEAYTYIGYAEEYENMTLILTFPSDYYNIQAFDPFGYNVTSQCIISSGQLEIPSELLSILGWWRVTASTINYAHDIATQISGPFMPTWQNASVYRSSNYTRASIVLGTDTQQPSSILGAEISWVMPNQTLWALDIIDNPAGNVFNSSPFVLGSANTTAGLWSVSVHWNNGTELAFGSTEFGIHHISELIVENAIIETESGNVISNMVRFRDVETNEFIMNPASIVVGNYSGSTITFQPNLIQNWWEANFNTSSLGGGEFLIQVNASSTYYDAAICTFVIRSILTKNTLNLAVSTTVIGNGDKHVATFSFSDTFGVGISGADVSFEFTGPADGISWAELTDIGGGNYSVEFTAVHSGNYVITISASKSYYEEAQVVLFMEVGDYSTYLSLENGTSAVISFGEQYRLVVRYTNGSGFGLDSASVSVVSTTPETGINYTTATNEGNGYFSIILTPANTTTYTLLIRASFPDYTTNFTTFTLTATTISAQLRVDQGLTLASIGVSQPFEILVFYEEIGGTPVNISLALLQVNFISYETLVPTIIPQAEGYLIRFPTDQIGHYEFTITASRAGFQNGAVQFTLFIRERAMGVVMSTPIWLQSDALNITLQLVEVDTGNPVTGAEVSYKLVRDWDVEMEGYLTETSDGVYSIFIAPGWYDGSAGYEIRIFAEKSTFVLDEDYYEFLVVQTIIPGEAVFEFLSNVLPPMGGFVILLVGSVSVRRTLVRKNKRKRAASREIEIRFKDANNILGIIVLHKQSGIPVYSKILKGGFEEAMLSAFITAIMHFRSEFDTVDEDDAYKILPISDIIRAIPTSNLICAFITISSSSKEQEEKMVGYTRAVGMTLDADLAERPTKVVDAQTAKTLEWFFDDFVDGLLLRRYQIGEKEPSGRFKHLRKALPEVESNGTFKLDEMIRALENSGLSEYDAYLLVMEAVDKEIILPIYQFNGTPDSETDVS